MNFFKQSSDQAREAFASMPMQSRVISVLLVIAIIISLGFLVRSDSSQNDEFLFGGQSFGSQEIAAVERAFSRAGLNDWRREGNRVRIPAKTKSVYYAALEESATLPMSLRSRVQDAIDATTVFDSSDLRKARESVAKEQELADTIMSFHDVSMAKVEYDRGERIGLGRAVPQSCSVFVQPEGTTPLARGRLHAITELMVGAYAGMSSDDVRVIDANSSSVSALSDDEDPMLRKQMEAESWMEQKVRKLLSMYPVRIAVMAEIDPTMDVEKTVLSYDSEPTNLSTKSRKSESSTNRIPNQGVPGTAINATGNRPAKLSDATETTKTKADERESRGVAGQQYENSKMASLQVRKMTVSIGLPSSFYREQYIKSALANDTTGTLTADSVQIDPADYERLKGEIEKGIQALITPLLPAVAAGDDAFPLVTIQEQVDPRPFVAEPPEMAKVALAWLANSWQTLAMILLGLVALMVARSAAKSVGESTPPEFNEGFGLELPEPPPEIESDEDKDSMTITGGSLKDELTELVENNPEVAANVIRGWIAEAA